MINELLESLLPEYERSTYNGDAAIATAKAQLLAEILKGKETYAQPKMYTVVTGKDGTIEQREGMEYIEAIPTKYLTELFKETK